MPSRNRKAPALPAAAACCIGLALFASPGLHAQDCEGVIALSKRKGTLLITKNVLERHAASFCSAYDRAAGSDMSVSLSATYRFLQASLGSADASMESIAEKFCSATDRHRASDIAYEQYIEIISPDAYRAYEQCLRMSQQELRFRVDVNSILPDEFSMSASFVSATGQAAAKVTVAPSKDVTCRWQQMPEGIAEIRSGSSAILSCARQDTSRRSYVTLVRSDTGRGQELMTIPWLPYDKEGIAVDSLAALTQKVAALETKTSEQDGKLAQLMFEANTIMLRAVDTRPLEDATQCPTGAQNLRGEIKGRVKFSKRFAGTPEVIVGLSEINLRGGDSLDMNRLQISITAVDEDGFDYSFVTWCRTVVQSATASWLAIAL